MKKIKENLLEKALKQNKPTKLIKGDPESQKAQILKFMQAGYHISPIQALNKFGCFRLAARIKDLRDDGFEINTEIVKLSGTKSTFAVYSLDTN